MIKLYRLIFIFLSTISLLFAMEPGGVGVDVKSQEVKDFIDHHADGTTREWVNIKGRGSTKYYRYRIGLGPASLLRAIGIDPLVAVSAIKKKEDIIPSFSDESSKDWRQETFDFLQKLKTLITEKYWTLSIIEEITFNTSYEIVACIAGNFGILMNINYPSDDGTGTRKNIKIQPVRFNKNADLYFYTDELGQNRFDLLIREDDYEKRLRARVIEDKADALTQKIENSIQNGRSQVALKLLKENEDLQLLTYEETIREVPTVLPIKTKREEVIGGGAGGPISQSIKKPLPERGISPPATPSTLSSPAAAPQKKTAPVAAAVVQSDIASPYGDSERWKEFYQKVFSDTPSITAEAAFLQGHLSRKDYIGATSDVALKALLQKAANSNLKTRKRGLPPRRDKEKPITEYPLDAVSIISDAIIENAQQKMRDKRATTYTDGKLECQNMGQRTVEILFTGGGAFKIRETQATPEEFEQILDALFCATKYIESPHHFNKSFYQENSYDSPSLKQHKRNMLLCMAMMWAKSHEEESVKRTNMRGLPLEPALEFIHATLGTGLLYDRREFIGGITDEIDNLQRRFGSRNLLSDVEKDDIETLRSSYPSRRSAFDE